ncbi:MAG: hypothetical protein A2W19_10530 [Spirochaetes bacterium RBG_16_49_21]|nr:MAG: hypothetical protein A2W19_10530 [Spirochaetes bacterium RBG_16_49_21]
MLYEIENVSQKEEHIFRRWFQDDYFDLIVWYDKKSEGIAGFQLCYNKLSDEHALTWHTAKGFSHNRIDDYPGIFHHPVTPILVPDGYFPHDELLDRFRQNSTAIDEDISRLVIEKISEYNNALSTAMK